MLESKTITLRCNSCGASLVAKEGREFMYCEHCGTKIYLIAKQEIKHTHRDETKIKEAEIKAELEKKREERALEAEKATSKSKLIISLVLIAVAILLFVLPFIDGDPINVFFTGLPAILCLTLAGNINTKFP